jgi:membrane-bound metal-dependent hydrolase YbcI (DUF457 family)
MATGHAATTLAVFVWGSRAAELSPATIVVAAPILIGAALLPDIDEPGSTVSRCWRWPGRLLSETLNRTLGHRGLTHTPEGAVAAGLLAGVASFSRWAVMALATLLALPAFTVSRELPHIGRTLWRARYLGAVAAGAAAMTLPDGSIVVPVAVTLGVLAHIAGDAVTNSGVPWGPTITWAVRQSRPSALPAPRRQLAPTGVAARAAHRASHGRRPIPTKPRLALAWYATGSTTERAVTLLACCVAAAGLAV